MGTEAAEGMAVQAFKATKGTVDSTIAWAEENDVATKAEDMLTNIQQFERDNDILITARAVGEVLFEGLKSLTAGAATPPAAKATKAAKTKKTKRAMKPKKAK